LTGSQRQVICGSEKLPRDLVCARVNLGCCRVT
jgi:hypothetical protein